MRNIKTMLRTSRDAALLFAATSGLLYLTACSSEVNYDGGQDVPETPATKAPFSVFSGNQSRVHNFGTSAGTRATAADFGFEMPETVTVPDNAVVVTGKYGWEVNNIRDTPVTIPAGTVYEEQFQVNTDLYIAGTLNMPNGFGGVTSGKKIYILPGGTLNFGGYLQPGSEIHNYGTLNVPSGIGIGEGVKIYSAVDMMFEGDLTINSNGELYSMGSITCSGKIMILGKTSACAYITTDDIVVNNAGTIHTSYFKANNLTFHSGNVVLKNNGLVDANVLFLSNENTRFTIEEGGTHAVVAANKFQTNYKDWPKYQFAYPIVTNFATCIIGNDIKDSSELGLQVSNGGATAYVPSDVCHPAYGTPPTTNPDPENPDPTTPDEPVKEIVKVTEIDPIGDEIDHGNHDHGIISATCINFGPDGTAYASYHLRGKGSKGCIEVINDNGTGGLSLGSYMITDSIDYNHIIIDGDYIYVVGNNTYDKYGDGTFKGGKGAIVGKINKNFTASETKTDALDIRELTTDEVAYIENASGDKIRGGYKNAGDGNTIVKYGNQYLVTTYRGYGIINPDLTRVPGTFVNTPGSCKHIALNGDGTKAAILSLDTYNESSSTASLKTFTLGSGESTFASVLASYDQIGTVAPVDGKNVVAFDGDDIYACLSTGGLARIRNGVVEEARKFGSGKMPVNGLAIDEKYLYVATGNFVYVLEKESMKSVCHYRAENEKSANYIALRNGKIYVAYGENGIMAFQLVEKEIEK